MSEDVPVRRRDFWRSKFDGSRHKLVRGVDYSVDERTMYKRARAAARRAGKNVVVTISREMGHVLVKAE